MYDKLHYPKYIKPKMKNDAVSTKKLHPNKDSCNKENNYLIEVRFLGIIKIFDTSKYEDSEG